MKMTQGTTKSGENHDLGHQTFQARCEKQVSGIDKKL